MAEVTRKQREATRINKGFMQRRLAPSAMYWDEDVKGFGVRTDKSGRPTTFVFQKSGGKRHNLGRALLETLDEARAAALRLSADHAVSDRTPKKRARLDMTLQEALENCLVAKRRGRAKQPRTVALMRSETERHAKALLTTKIARIRHADIADLHQHVTENSGPVAANRLVRHLSSIYGVAGLAFPLDSDWWRDNRNDEDGHIEEVHDLPGTGVRLGALENQTLANFYRFVAVSSLRKTDALTVRWDDIERDGRKGWLWRPEPKGGARRAFWLPITTQMRATFDLQAAVRESEWVFPGNVHGERIKDPLKRGLLPTPHQFRVTWDTRALTLGCPLPVAATLMNHKIEDKKNMTLKYFRVKDADLVLWAQRVADSIWADLGAQPANDVHHDTQFTGVEERA